MQSQPRRSLFDQIFRAKSPTPLAERQPLCSGAATGFQCIHYWPTAKVGGSYRGSIGDVEITFDDLHEVQRQRHCTLSEPTRPLPTNPSRLPIYCPRYEASHRPFDPLFEIAPPKELDLPAHIAGLIPTAQNTMDAVLTGQPFEAPNAPKDWDAEPMAPVLPRMPGDPPDAPARRGFVHCEAEDRKTVCLMKAALKKCADLVPGDVKRTLAQVTCPGCLAEIASRPGVTTVMANRVNNLMAALEEEANRSHDAVVAAETKEESHG